jgi:hypothetical protein
MRKFSNLTEVKQANKAIGNHFFGKDTTRFFRSKYGELFNGCYFITSEQFVGSDGIADPRKYTLRIALSDGSIETVGAFNKSEDARQLKKWAKSFPERLQEAIECANKEFNGKPVGMGFVASALVEPTNNRDGSFSMDTFAGACTWLIKNYKELGFSYISYFEEKYNERMKQETAE